MLEIMNNVGTEIQNSFRNATEIQSYDNIYLQETALDYDRIYNEL